MSDRLAWTNAELDDCVIARFDRVADRWPGRTAIDTGHAQITYRELLRRSHQIAGGLSAMLADRGNLIALLLPPGIDFAAAYLGVLRAGQIAFPVGLDNPSQRLESILTMGQPRLVVTEENGPIPSLVRGEVVTLQELSGHRGSSPSGESGPRDPGSVYLTSGSTGDPKGVIRDQCTMLHHTMVYSQDGGIHPEDRQSALYSVQSGASMPDMLGALLNGGTLCPLAVDRLTAAQFAGWVRDLHLTILHLPVSLYRLWLDSLRPGDGYAGLRLILVGGEAVFREDIERGRQQLGASCTFMHQLASTETNYISRFPIGADTALLTEVLPVGRPAAGKEVMLLDEDRQPVHTGQVGEIAVRSRFLASGYWRNPELTSARFQADSDKPGLRTYFTGDLARFDEDGLLHFVGRRDKAVRIRGHRVDPPVVEAALQSLGIARQVAVKPWSQTGGETVLVAYAVPMRLGSMPELDLLRQRLAERLPEHMLPSALVELERLPVLRSGKIDRDNLPPPGPDRPRLRTAYLAPRDPIERRLIAIWERVLGLRPIGLRDTFFGLGGNSLQAMRLVAAVNDQFGEVMPPSLLLEAPTAEQQALLLKTNQPARPASRVVGLQTAGTRPPLFCVSPRTVNIIAYHHLAVALGPEQPVYVLYAVNMPDRPDELSWVEHEAQVLLDELRALQPAGPHRLAGYSGGGVVALEMAQSLTRRGQPPALVALFDAYGPTYRRTLPGIPQSAYRSLQVLLRVLQSLDEFGPWIRGHWRELRGLTWADRLFYLTRKGATNLRWRASRLGRSIRRMTERRKASPAPAGRIGRSFTRYDPQAYPGQVAVFRAERQPLGIRPDPFMGWQDVVTGQVELHQVPGYHDSILSASHVGHLASVLRESLSAVEQDGSSSTSDDQAPAAHAAPNRKVD